MIKPIHKISKVLFLVYIVFFVALSLMFWKSPESSQSVAVMTISTLLFVGLVWIDALKVLGKKKAFWFILIATLISFGSEYIGVNFGGVFGGAYHYNSFMKPMIGGVPIAVIAMWTAVVYICYRLAVIIAGKKTVFKNTYERLIEYFFIALVASLAAVSWDLVWDPLAVELSTWTWHNPGLYFGIPTLNFTGWIIVVFLSCFIFELVFKLKRTETKDIIIPFSGYLYLLVSTIILSLSFNNSLFALLAFILMSPYLLIIVLVKLKER